MAITGEDWIAADLADALEGPGSSSVAYGTVETRGMYDEEETLMSDATGNTLRVRARTVRVRAAAFVSQPPQNDTITVGGVIYRIRGVRPESDGLVWVIDLVPA